MGKSEREKGKRWEREVANALRKAMPGASINRGLQSRNSVDKVADVQCPVFWPECKVGKEPPLRPALEQAERDAPPDRICLAVVKYDRQPAIVALRWDDFLPFLEEWWRLRQEPPPPKVVVRERATASLPLLEPDP